MLGMKIRMDLSVVWNGLLTICTQICTGCMSWVTIECRILRNAPGENIRVALGKIIYMIMSVCEL